MSGTFKLSLRNTRPILIGVVYLSEIENSFCETFSCILHELKEPLNKRRAPCEIICVRDFNYNQLKANESDWKEFEKSMGTFRLQQVITKPTLSLRTP